LIHTTKYAIIGKHQRPSRHFNKRKEGERKMAQNLEKEFEYYLEHQDELVREYKGKFIVIKDSRVIGAFDSELEAVENTAKQYELGTFLVQKCEPGTDSYTQTYHSRVALV
jgi:hypothetical protein